MLQRSRSKFGLRFLRQILLDNILPLRILGLEQTNIKNDTYNMLTRIHNWPEFSNSVADGSTTNKSSTNSLETIHDHIHLYCGGDLGHMAQLELAGEYPPTQ